MLKDHMMNLIGEEKMWTDLIENCNSCGKILQNNKMLKEHMTDLIEKCPGCGKIDKITRC